jgi:hypothetical protein
MAYDKEDFFYYNNYVKYDVILQELEKLKKYKYILVNTNPVKKKLKLFNGRFVMFLEEYKKNRMLHSITDYFSQCCRVRCINNLHSKESPYDYFVKNRYKILKEISHGKKKIENIGYEDVSEYLYKNTKQCTNFNTTVIISILKMFKPTRYLDPCSGWGDRLIGAIAYGCEYTGIDPSNCMNPIYNDIIKKLVPNKQRERYKVIKSGFETAVIESNFYDLVFTSPPFFDFEIYENNKKQSNQKFNTLKQWLHGFLFPLAKKSQNALKTNGYFGLYISDYTGISYKSKLFKYIKNNCTKLKYKGDIHYWTPENKNVVRSIHFWRKENYIGSQN